MPDVQRYLCAAGPGLQARYFKRRFQAVYEEAMKYCMVSMMLADGEIDENEMLSVQN